MILCRSKELILFLYDWRRFWIYRKFGFIRSLSCFIISYHNCGRTATKCIQPLLCLWCSCCFLFSYCHQCCNDCRPCAGNWYSTSFCKLWRNFFAYKYNSSIYSDTLGCRQANGVTIKSHSLKEL